MEQTNAEFLKELNQNLSRHITPSWRVQSFSDQKPFAVVIPYLDKVDVMRHLDAYATYGWQRDHYTIVQDVYCKIGITFPDGSVQWRSDAGTGGSGIEVEKSKASDSFKRAGSNWGIGRNLSEVDIVRVPTNLPLVKGQPKPYLVDKKGNRVWDIEKHINDSIKSGELKVENILGAPDLVVETPQSELTKPVTKTVTKPVVKKVEPKAELPEKPEPILSPSTEFDTPAEPKPNEEELAARAKAQELYSKLDQSRALGYIIKGKKIIKYSTIPEFVSNHNLAEVRSIYAELIK